MKKYLRTAIVAGAALLISLALIFASCAAPAAPPAPGAPAEPAAPVAPVAPAAPAETAADFFKGKTITISVMAKPGGGFDQCSRLYAPFLEKYTGANVVVVNKPGGGMILAPNWVYTKGSREGTDIGIVSFSTMIWGELFDVEGVEYELLKYNWLASGAAYYYTFFIRRDLPWNTFEELVQNPPAEPLRIPKFSMGPGSGLFDKLVLEKDLGVPVKLIYGYASTPVATAAIIRGEMEAAMYNTNSIIAFLDDIKPLAVLGPLDDPQLPDLPKLSDIVPPMLNTDDGKAFFDLHVDLSSGMVRVFMAPPGVPQDRIDFLREAFKKASEDPELMARSDRIFAAAYWQSADAVVSTIETHLGMDERMVKIIEEEGW